MKPPHATNKRKQVLTCIQQQHNQKPSTDKPVRSVEKKTGGFVVLTKQEVEANRCKAYSYIM